MYTITAFNYSSFDVDGPDPFLDQAVRNREALNRTVIALKRDAKSAQVRIMDDDPTFGGPSDEKGRAATLAEDVSLAGSDFSRGQRVVMEYSYLLRGAGSSKLSEDITIFVFRIDGEIIGVAADRPLVPGQKYRILAGGADKPTRDYASLYNAEAPICFLSGTLIETPAGPCPVNMLRVGDEVMTRDCGARPILWIGGGAFAGRANATPVVIRAGRLGNHRDLVLSPNHRVLVGSGSGEGLLPVKALIDGRGVVAVPSPRVIYVHLLLDGHHVVLAEGAGVESLWPGSQVSGQLAAAAREGLSRAIGGARAAWTPARPFLRPGAYRRAAGVRRYAE